MKSSISLCMIVKDEESRISGFLEHLRNLVDEMVIVDTGSQDQTIQIASKMGAKVIPFKWGDDFAAARNFGVEHCKSQWILVLDADEVLSSAHQIVIKEWVKTSQKAIRFVHRHYVADSSIMQFRPNLSPRDKHAMGIGYYDTRCVRLFPNTEQFRFTGRVHELVERTLFSSDEKQIEESDLIIHHYGHLDISRRNQRKDLYLQLGRLKVIDYPEDWQSWFELALAEQGCGNAIESRRAFERALTLNPDELVVILNISSLLTQTGETHHSIKLLQNFLKSNQHPEVLIELGRAYLRIGDPRAKEVTMMAVGLDERCLRGHMLLAELLAREQQFQSAEACYKKVLEICPDHDWALTELGRFRLLEGRLNEADSLLTQARRSPCAPVVLNLLLGDLRLAQKNFHEAKSYLDKFITDTQSARLSTEENEIREWAKRRSHKLKLKLAGSESTSQSGSVQK